MSYTPLAVKYRPKKFSDLVGQQGTLKALTNGIALGREPRCIIFSGIRGVGKTTLARLYAMALNCERPENGEPCGDCGNCLAIQSGTHENVTEIDGASNTSVEDIRNLQETMSYVPQRGRFKVYIVDEVHMLSNSAFNAFLKTLEEPPEDVIFILATTELDKIPKTVQSRCQTFFLAKMSPADIQMNLERILTAEGIAYQQGALQLVALEGQGSMRDALTFLDQVIAVAKGELTEELLAEFSQNLPFSACVSFLQAMLAKDGQALIEITDGWHDKGIDYRKTTAELIRIVRNSMILAGVGDSAISRKALSLSDGELDATLELSAKGAAMDANRIFRSLVSVYHQLDGGFLDRFLIENTCLEWCYDPGLAPSGGPRGGSAPTPPGGSSDPEPQGNARTSRGPSRLSTDLSQKLAPQAKEPARPAPAAPAAAQIPPQTKAPQAKKPARPAPEPAAHVAEPARALERPKPVAALERPPLRVTEEKEPEPPTKVESAPANRFPPNWREFLTQWAKAKPFLARVVEDTHVVEYGPERIHLAVDPTSMAGSKLLSADQQRAFRENFKAIFGFEGSLEVMTLADYRAGADAPLPETVLETKAKERQQKHEELINNAKNHPLTLSALKTFGGKIESIDILDDHH